MNDCTRFDEWLDQGRPEATSAAALDHARACDRCTGLWHAMESLERELERLPEVAAPAGLADAVMARVAVTPQAPRTSVLVARVLREPSVIGSLVAAALLVAGRDELERWGVNVAAQLARPWPLPAWLHDPAVVTALAVTLATPIAWWIFASALDASRPRRDRLIGR